MHPPSESIEDILARLAYRHEQLKHAAQAYADRDPQLTALVRALEGDVVQVTERVFDLLAGGHPRRAGA